MHSTAEEHMDDLMDAEKIWSKIITPQMSVYMGLEFQIQGDKVCYTPLKDKCNAIRNLESP